MDIKQDQLVNAYQRAGNAFVGQMSQNFVVLRDDGVVPTGARVRFATGQGRGRVGTPRGRPRGGGGGLGLGQAHELRGITLKFNVLVASKWDITGALAPTSPRRREF